MQFYSVISIDSVFGKLNAVIATVKEVDQLKFCKIRIMQLYFVDQFEMLLIYRSIWEDEVVLLETVQVILRLLFSAVCWFRTLFLYPQTFSFRLLNYTINNDPE